MDSGKYQFDRIDRTLTGFVSEVEKLYDNAKPNTILSEVFQKETNQKQR